MHAVATRFRFRAPPTQEDIQRVEREVVDLIERAPGFRAYYGVRLAETEALAISIWDSREAAEQALERIAPATQQVIGEHLAAPPERQMGDVVIYRGP